MNVKEGAYQYYMQGFNVIPFRFWHDKIKSKYEKKPIILKWEEFHGRRQTQKEFEAIKWDQADGFGVLAGAQNNEGLYLGGIDFDTKGERKNHSDTIEKTRNKLNQFRITQRETTINDGEHLVYLSKKPVENIDASPNYYLELLGETRNKKKTPMILWPSQGYRKLNDNPPTVLDDLTQHFREVLGLQTQVEAPKETERKKQRKIKIKNPRPCMMAALTQQLDGKNGNYMRLAIAAEFKRHGYAPEQIVNFFRGQKDFNEEKTLEKIEKADPNKTAKCKSIEKWGYCLPNCKFFAKEDEQETIIETWPEIPEPTPYETEEKLNQELMEYLVLRLDLRYREQYATIIAAIKLSWIIDLFDTTPYLFFYGPKRSGKTRALDLLEQLCYKAIYVGNTSRAGIYWMMENYKPTLLLDETESYTGKDEAAQDIQRLLNIGYKRGPRVFRLEKDEHGNPRPVAYDTFGFKALAGTRFLSSTLEDRCIIFKMVKNSRRMKPVDKEKARELRAKLHQWRLDVFDNLDVSLERYRGIGEQTNKQTSPITDERLCELFIPLIRAGGKRQECQICQMVITLALKTQETWNEDLALTLDAEVLEKIKEVSKVQNKFATSEVARLFNEKREEDEELSTRSTGYVIRRLGFEHTRMPDGKRGWLWDEGLYRKRTYQFQLAKDPNAKLDDNFGTLVPTMGKYDWEEGKAKESF